MKQNIYDDPKFFEGYSQMRRHESGLNMAVDQPAMRSLLPPLTNKRVLDLGCGFGKMCRYAIEQGADANGNLTSDGTNTYTWDARNHLSAISGAAPGSFAYVYDALNRRVSKSVAGNTTQFLYDRLNPVQELQSGSASANLLTGLNLDEYFQRTDSAGTRDLLTDALGSTWGLADSSGTVQSGYSYQPFGSVTPSGTTGPNPYQYTGRENDSGAGPFEGDLYYNRARYYSPVLQRFMSQDPIGFGGGDTNLYGYVRNDPINWTDPLGLTVSIYMQDPDFPEIHQIFPEVYQAYQKVKSTPTGSRICRQLEDSPREYLIVPTLEATSAFSPDSGLITINPTTLPPGDLDATLAHELGHASGIMDEQQDVDQVEKQIRKELGEPVVRQRYYDLP